MSDETTIARYLAAVPTEEESARRAVEPYRDLDAKARLAALADLLRSMDEILAGREPLPSPEDEDFWRHWKDPLRGRPR